METYNRNKIYIPLVIQKFHVNRNDGIWFQGYGSNKISLKQSHGIRIKFNFYMLPLLH